MNVLQQYMIEKAKILGELGTYVTDDDIDELGSWSDSEIENTALAMIDGIQQVQSEIVGKQQSGSVTGPVALRIRLSLISSALCPWCQRRNCRVEGVLIFRHCVVCGYGARHGTCNDMESDWAGLLFMMARWKVLFDEEHNQVAFAQIVEELVGYPLPEIYPRLIAVLSKDEEDV